MKKKRFCGNILYRGCAFDVEFLASNQKEASERIDVSLHHLKTYFSCGLPATEEFPEIRCKPYGTISVEALGGKDVIDYETMKKAVDAYQLKKYQKYL